MLPDLLLMSVTGYDNVTEVDRFDLTTTSGLESNTSATLLHFSTESLFTSAPSSVSEESYKPGISEDTVKNFNTATKTFVNPAVCLLGFVGNSLGVGVLLRQARTQKLSIFWYLTALTLLDVVFLALGIIWVLPSIFMVYNPDLGRYLAQYMRLGLVYVDMNFTHSARFIVVVMSCERLVSVLKPLHVKETWLAMYPVRIIILCLIFNALFLLPVLINAKVVTMQGGNTTEYMFTFRNYETFMAPFMVVQVVVQSFIPLIFLVPINIAIPLQYYRISAKRRSVLNVASNEAMNQQGKITATVMVITFMYILLSAPLIAIKLLQFVNPDFNMNGKYRIVLWFIIDLSKFLAYLNAANDFVIYFVVSNSYRAVFKELYCGRCRGKPASKVLIQDK